MMALSALRARATVATWEEAPGVGAGDPARTARVCSEDVQSCLQSVMRCLKAGREAERDSMAACKEARGLVSCLLDADVPARLIACLDVLEFEARKAAMHFFSAVLRAGTELDCYQQVV